ncbi:MAG: hypothetical protein QM726_19475 [Chitinophagaceae bacterium]
MLTQKKDKRLILTPIKKGSAKIITLKANAENDSEDMPKKEPSRLMPPATEFNTGYIKARDNDIL